MMMNFYKYLLVLLLFIPFTILAQKGDPKLTEVWTPTPTKVKAFGVFTKAPDDAFVLFENAADSSNWIQKNGKPFQWALTENYFTVTSRKGNIVSKQAFGNCQLHIEWRTPNVVTDSGQGRGNSGIFFMERYELQILDSYNNNTYVNGMAGSIYKQHIPLVNASLPPGEWQSYDVLFTAPQFYENGILKSPARMMVLHNGVLIHNNVVLTGSTQYIGIANYQKHNAKAPLMLQDHGNPVSFRNIWIRQL
jgi:Domain of Unknown Function (DUF1080)